MRILPLALALLVGACDTGGRANESGDTLVAPVVITVATSRRFVDAVEGFGTIGALPDNVNVVSPLYSGRVARLLAHVGARTTADEPVCEIALDPAAVAEIEKLRQTLALADRNLDRERRAFEAGVGPRVVLEQAQVAASAARAEYDARTRGYDGRAQRLILRAPITGLVTDVAVRVGQQVDQTTKVLTIVDPDALVAEVRFDAAAGARIQVGQTGTVSSPQSSRAAMRASVVRTAPILDPVSQRVDVWLRPDAETMPPGTWVRATVEVGVRDGIAVPRSALVKTDRGYRVFIVDGDVAHARDVVVGNLEGDVAEIRDGVAAGEQVASSGAQELVDGVRIKIESRAS